MNRKMYGKNNKRYIEFVFMTLLLLVVALVIMFQHNKKEVLPDEKQESEQHAPVVYMQSSNDKEEEEISILEHVLPFYESNSDTVGYIKIEDTQVDYPVVYSGDNEFYMSNNFKKEESQAGAIFMDYRCDFQNFGYTRNVILYGHRMKDGSMFKEITKYKDDDFYESHRTFSFDTLYQQYICEVFAVFITDIEFYYIDTVFNSDHEWMNFMKECYSMSMYQDDLKIFNPNDMILTLSTCTTKKNERFVVMAKIREIDLEH